RDCLWNATVVVAWIQVNPSSGQGGGALTVVVSPNPGSSPRVATISLNSTPITIVQAGVSASSAPAPAVSDTPAAGETPPAPTPAPGQTPVSDTGPPVDRCVPSVSPRAITVVSGGASGQISVSLAAGCSWSATATDGWINLTGASGVGAGVVRYQVD